jgi:hypothetical protein
MGLKRLDLMRRRLRQGNWTLEDAPAMMKSINTFGEVIRGLLRKDTGRTCRSCGLRIEFDDTFGRGEGVCRRCRADPDGATSARTDGGVTLSEE